MPTYYNNNRHDVALVGPEGQTITVRAGTKIDLPEFYGKYAAAGSGVLSYNQLIQQRPKPPVAVTPTTIAPTLAPQPIPLGNRYTVVERARAALVARRTAPPRPTNQHRVGPTPQPAVQFTAQPQPPQPATLADTAQAAAWPKQPLRRINATKQVVGRQTQDDAAAILRHNLADGGYPISNGIGVGILSFNRGPALRRLLESIIAHTNLAQTTVFISDDGSTDPETVAYLGQLEKIKDFVVLRNGTRLGVAGNSNRLLRCLSRFPHFLLLNDDVEVLAKGWDKFYCEAMRASGLKHLIFRQAGVYGAESGTTKSINGIHTQVVTDKPHGAVLAGCHELLDTIGYFDEQYGYYGFEHVDWSQKASEFGLQPAGFYDIAGSQAFFRLHATASSTPDRSACYQAAKIKFEARVSCKCMPSESTRVDSVSYVLPVRDLDRSAAIRTVLNNIRAQRFPVIDLVLVEQDVHQHFNPTGSLPLTYDWVGQNQPLFNKSLAFNRGVQLARHDHLILHDADILAPSWYTRRVFSVLRDVEACHLGAKVIYAVDESTQKINSTSAIDLMIQFDRVVGYYEGGSLGCHKAAYWRIGGFNEDFKGYGCEDCDFYYRLSRACSWHGNRHVDLLHLSHGRAPNWSEAHKVNQQLEQELRDLPLEEYIRRQRARIDHYLE